MRELILKMSMSLDGFVSDLDGRNTWMFGADEEAKAWAVETLWMASLHIMGSHSFRAMAPFWPTSTMVFAPPMNQIPKAVFSKQGPAILKAAATTKELSDALDRAGKLGGRLRGRRRPGRGNRQAESRGRQTDPRPRRRQFRAQPDRPEPGR
jgi:hypothetical protein